MRTPTVPPKWTSAETLQLLQLSASDTEWSLRVAKLQEEFGNTRPKSFFTENSCKQEYDRILSTGHPEHFLRQKGEKYSQKDLLRAWITYLQKKAKEEAARENEILLIRMREKADLFNKLFSDDCPLTEKQITRLLEEARLEDSKRDQEVVNKEVALAMQKLKELDDLHKQNPEIYGPLRITIPSASKPTVPPASGSYSPIKPLFEGLTPPARPGTSSQQSSPSSGMSLRSQKALSCSPQKQSKATSNKNSVNSSSKSVAGAAQKDDSSISTLKSPTRAQKTPFRTSDQEMELAAHAETKEEISQPGDADVQKAEKSQRVETSQRVLRGSDRNESAAPKQDMEERPTDPSSIGTTPSDSKSSEMAQMSESAAKAKEKPPEKRQLRAHKDAVGVETVSTRSSTRPNRSTRKEETEERASPQKQQNLELRSRRPSTAGTANIDSSFTTPTKPESHPAGAARSRRGTEKSEETEEGTLHRRRSERKRLADTTGCSSEMTPTANPLKRKRIAVEEDEGEGPLSNDSEVAKDNAPKRRRLSFREVAQESVQSVSQELSNEKVATNNQSEDQSANQSELNGKPENERMVLGTEEESTAEEKLSSDALASRRGSLRSAAPSSELQAKQQEKQDHPKEEQKPSSENSQKTSLPHSDSDEEKTLGDIRNSSKSRSHKKGKSHRRSHGTSKSGTDTPHSSRRHSKKEELDENALEQKALMTTAWRIVSSHRHAAIFAHPVSERDARGYSRAVKSRMDLSTLKKQLDSGEVRDMIEFKRRLLLMFANAVMFNSTGHDVNIYAKEMAADSLNSLKMMEKDVLYVKGGAHVTRRSAAFAAEEALLERRKFSGVRVTSVGRALSPEEEAAKEKETEESPNDEKTPISTKKFINKPK